MSDVILMAAASIRSKACVMTSAFRNTSQCALPCELLTAAPRKSCDFPPDNRPAAAPRENAPRLISQLWQAPALSAVPDLPLPSRTSDTEKREQPKAGSLR